MPLEQVLLGIMFLWDCFTLIATVTPILASQSVLLSAFYTMT